MILTDAQILLAVALTAVFVVGTVVITTWAYHKLCNGWTHFRTWHRSSMITEAGRRAIARKAHGDAAIKSFLDDVHKGTGK